jgi:putative ABC transport system permease protein
MKIKAVIRSVSRHPLNSLVIIVSLAVGMACMNLIAIFIYKEYHADSFQKNRDRIYELYCNDPWIKGSKIYFTKYGAGEYMKNNFSEVEDYCRVTRTGPVKITVGGQDFFDVPQTIAASSNFFKFFSYQLLSNSPEDVLVTPQDLVISEDVAHKYFDTSNPIGQQIVFVSGNEKLSMNVSGVFRKPVETTQLNFDMVRLIGEKDSRCYLLLDKNADANQLREKLVKNSVSIPILSGGTPNNYFLKDMHSAYFDTMRNWGIENSRDKNDLMVAFVIAILILTVALINYLGLTNNRLIEKTREHSIRRLNGGSKTNLSVNFIQEMAILTGAGWLMSMAIMFILMPFFNQLTSSTLNSAFIFSFPNGLLLLVVPTFVLLITLLFVYLNLRKGTPLNLLRSGNFKTTGKIQIPVLNVAQLAVSVVLIVSSSIIIKQINYITRKDIGLNKDVLEVRVPSQHKDISAIFKAELEKHAQIELVSIAQASPVLEHMLLKLSYDDNGTQKEYMPSVFPGDQNYPKTLGVKITNGEDFSEETETNNGKCIINESLAKLFPGQNLVGQQLPGDKRMTVIGVVKDFNYGSLRGFIEPGYIVYSNTGFYLMVKPLPGQEAKARVIVSETWEKLIPDFQLTVESIGERYEWMHRENVNYARLIGACCIISVFLSMIGLFAISFNSSRKRVKEIGIRKVNGAKISEILTLLNKDFIKWVAIAFVIATPISYYIMNKWLENFAYKTELSWWIFALAGLLALGIALLTVSWQSWRAATRNPVKALRYE